MNLLVPLEYINNVWRWIICTFEVTNSLRNFQTLVLINCHLISLYLIVKVITYGVNNRFDSVWFVILLLCCCVTGSRRVELAEDAVMKCITSAAPSHWLVSPTSLHTTPDTVWRDNINIMSTEFRLSDIRLQKWYFYLRIATLETHPVGLSVCLW